MSKDEAFDQVVAALYAAPLRPELWAVALDHLSKSINVSQAGLIEHRPAENVHTIFAFVGDPIKEGGHLYEQHYWQYDEWTKRLHQHLSPGNLIYGEKIWPEAALRRSAFFNDFLVKYDVCQIAGVASATGRHKFEVLSVYRGLTEPAFDEDQYRILSRLAPHLETALATRRLLVSLKSRVSDLESALNQIGVASILLDRRGKPLIVNAAAQEICDKRDGLLLSSSGLAANSVRESAELRALIDRTILSVISKEFTQGGAAVISKKTGRQLHLLVAPIPPRLLDSPGNAVAMLLISDPEKERTLPSHILRQLFSLTPAESRLAQLLLSGQTLPDAADQLGVSRETVRSQLKSIMQKTGTKRQGELVGLLATLNTLR